MLPYIDNTLLLTHNELDEYRAVKIQMLFEQEIILDFSRFIEHEVYNQTLVNLYNGRLTWAYLIEECLRVNREIRKTGLIPIQMTFENIVEFIDFDELRDRFQYSPSMNYCLLTDDVDSLDMEFDNISVDLVGLVAKILYGNSETLSMVDDQLRYRLKSMDYQGLADFHCIGFKWLGHAGIAKFGAYQIV